MKGSRDAKIMSFFDLPSRENKGAFEHPRQFLLRVESEKEEEEEGQIWLLQRANGRSRVMKHFRAKEFGFLITVYLDIVFALTNKH
jgi:hypothetical protein